ncbi:MAG TPA: VOC family protein [Lichenihabitans sp.]|jgi:catechol 2,3-dioxygenase-like lactoylglutathione lyase family enzyme|nr:VOC family protein [Lichenihabitans sp.]
MSQDTHDTRPKLVGLNHIALEVGSVEEALAFYGAIFAFTLRGRGDRMAFIGMGDQFLALMEGPVRQPAGKRHFGLVVEDRAAVQRLAEKAGATLLERNNFLARGATGSRSWPIAMSSSPRPMPCCGAWA